MTEDIRDIYFTCVQTTFHLNVLSPWPVIESNIFHTKYKWLTVAVYSLFKICSLIAGEPGAGGIWKTIQVSDPYFGGTDREYLIYIPSTYTPNTPAPLILGNCIFFFFKVTVHHFRKIGGYLDGH